MAMASGAPGAARATDRKDPVTSENTIGATVRSVDGIELATDVYLPTGPGPWPVVLLRTYLGKASHANEAAGWAQHGFVCVVQDVRGRFGSGGEWRPYTTERRDGCSAVAWILEQPWCDGQVAAVGGSYGAFAAWSAALGHPAVRAVISAVPAMRSMPLQPEDGGVLPLLSRICWWLEHAGVRQPRRGLVEELLETTPHKLLHLPLVTLPESLGVDLPGWREALLGTADESPGAEAPLEDAELAALDVPALHVGGWHDPFCSESLRHFHLVGRLTSPRPPRGLVLGPWWHRLGAHRPAAYGERRYGENSRFPLGKHQAQWLRRALSRDLANEPPLHLFLGGENRWCEAESWADRPLISTNFYCSDDRLLLEPPLIGDRISFPYDPADPHPCRRSPVDESCLETRRDVASFVSQPLEASCTVLGAPRLTLWASTDAPSTDWLARLLEVTDEGRLLYLAHGMVDARRALRQRGEHLEPGIPHCVVIQLSPIGFTVPAGHRLRLEVTSSGFPSYARNLACGESRRSGVHLRTARQTVYWGPDLTTHLELPIHAEVRPAPILRPTSTANPTGPAALLGGVT